MIIGKINFPIYIIIVLIAILIGMAYIYIALRKDKYKNNLVLLYFLMYFTFTIVFGKIISIAISNNEETMLTAGLSSYGGLIGCVVAAIIFECILPTNKKIIKYTIISLPLVYSISKIACFIVGCCYGLPYNGIFSVTYLSGLNIKLFPIQIVETIVFFIVFIVCNRLRHNKYAIYITIIIASFFKFLLDFLRYEHINKIITFNQIFSVILLCCALLALIYKIIFKGKKA